MAPPILYSFCVFLIVSLLLSVIFAERIKQNEKKHMIAGAYIALAAGVHLATLILHEMLKK